jgi:hypothetical protein
MVNNRLFEAFSTGVTRLMRSLGSQNAEPFWEETLRTLRRCRTAASATPLPFSHSSLGLAQAFADVAARSEQVGSKILGTEAEQLRELASLLGELSDCHENPLGDAALDVLDGRDNSGILIPTSRYQTDVAEWMKRRPMGVWLTVLTPTELAMQPPMRALAVVGTTTWYTHNPFPFLAPRAEETVALRWTWVRDTFPREGSLIDGRRGKSSRSRRERSEDAAHANLDGSDLAPSIDWAALADRVSDRGGAPVTEPVDARIFLLAGGMAVALGVGGDSKVHTVEPDLEGSDRIADVPVDELDEGDYVLLRSQGAGDLVVEVADSILGAARSAELRGIQAAWKTDLRSLVASRSPDEIIARLRRAGSSRANYMNLRNWMSPRSLRTWDIEDFAAIMDVIGRGDETEAIWAAMGALDSAHRKAGHAIRSMLTEVVAEADLGKLFTRGWMNFQLPDHHGGGKLTAYRIESINPDMIRLDEDRLARVLGAEDLWLG